MKKVRIAALIEENKAEIPHLEHVTALVDTIYNALKRPLGLSHADSKILHAAAMLHDVSYASNPAKHAHTSAALVSQRSFYGLTEIQRDCVAAVIALHRRKYKPLLKNSTFIKRLKNRDKALQLAAILRVADGLDHSHVQDCRIRKLAVGSKDITLHVVSQWYSNNANWARGKADLWQDVMPAQLRIVETPPTASPHRYNGIVQKQDSVLEAFRSLLYSQYRIYLDNIAGVCAGEDTKPLHDLRVALRRGSMLFPFFKPELTGLDYKPIRRFIKELTRELGPFRDEHVWLEYILSTCKELDCENLPKWQRLIRSTQQRIRRNLPILTRVLTRPENIAASGQLSLMLRSHLPYLETQTPTMPYRVYAAERLTYYLNDLLQRRLISKDDHPEAAHDIRKIIRKMRYYAEYSDVVLPPIFSELTSALKAVADAMGTMHDMDVHIQHMKSLHGRVPVALKRHAKAQREKAWTDYRQAWRTLTDHKYQSRVYKSLKRIRTS